MEAPEINLYLSSLSEQEWRHVFCGVLVLLSSLFVFGSRISLSENPGPMRRTVVSAFFVIMVLGQTYAVVQLALYLPVEFATLSFLLLLNSYAIEKR